MIPVRDVIPARTAPAVTMAILALLGAAFTLAEVREWWLPWLTHAAAIWLAGGAVEDRLGHGRFAALALACLAVAAAALLGAGIPGLGPPGAPCGMVAGVLAAHLTLFPRSRILTIVPVVVGVELEDVPAWAIFGIWAVVQTAAAWSEATWSAPAALLGMAVSAAAGAAAGMLGAVVLKRPERMRVDWWDPPRRRP